MSQTKALHFAKFYSFQPSSVCINLPQGSKYDSKTERPVPTILSTKKLDPEKSLTKKWVDCTLRFTPLGDELLQISQLSSSLDGADDG